MSAFMLLSAAMAVLSGGWATYPLWHDAGAGAATARPTRQARALPTAMLLFMLAVSGIGYALLGSPSALHAGPNAAQSAEREAARLAELALSALAARPRELDAPRQLIEQALRLDAGNPKALALAGTLALKRRDAAAAVRYWEQLASRVPPDDPRSSPLQASLAQARRLATP
jgi:cytochrome c-type biogenesis protein CcmH/NrfG